MAKAETRHQGQQRSRSAYPSLQRSFGFHRLEAPRGRVVSFFDHWTGDTGRRLFPASDESYSRRFLWLELWRTCSDDTEGGDFIRRVATVLESIIKSSSCRAEQSSHKPDTGSDVGFPTWSCRNRG